MKNEHDAYGEQLLEQYHSQTPSAELIERDDGCIDFGSEAGLYFTEYEKWSPGEREAIALAAGRILDIGCGAGRHALYLQEKGFDVTGIDNSSGAIEVCRARGLKKAFVRPIENVHEFPENYFDTILMFGNNFGLFGSPENAPAILEKFSRITAPAARIIAQTRNPYLTDDLAHLKYHEFNCRRGRLPGQLTLRVRYGETASDWFDYLFVSPEEMSEIFKDTGWQIERFILPEKANYFAVISKK